MPLDPQCEEVLRRVAVWPRLDDMTVTEARAHEARRRRELGGSRQAVARLSERIISHAGREVRVQLYEPVESPTGGVLVWFHGGGWVLGSPELSDDQTSALANASGCVVVSVDYALAPERKFPAGLEDAFSALHWVQAHASELGAESDRLAVGGDSAGGNLAAAVALAARDRGGPKIRLQLLIYPVTGYDAQTFSRRAFSEGYWLTEAAMEWFWSHYLAEPDDGRHPYASPLLAPKLERLPAAVVLTAEFDVLRDEGEAYAARLSDAGVPVELHRFDGMLHGFLACSGVVDRARDAVAVAGRALRTSLGREAACGAGSA